MTFTRKAYVILGLRAEGPALAIFSDPDPAVDRARTLYFVVHMAEGPTFADAHKRAEAWIAQDYNAQRLPYAERS